MTFLARGAIVALTSTVFFGAAVANSEMDIVDTAVEAGNFGTLAAALDAADLIDTLKGEGPFTVFAPTDIMASNGVIHVIDTVILPE